MTYLAVVITYSKNCILKKLELAQKKKFSQGTGQHAQKYSRSHQAQVQGGMEYNTLRIPEAKRVFVLQGQC